MGSRALCTAAGILLGFSLWAIANAVVIATLRLPPGGIPVRVAHHLFDAAQTLGVGLAVAAPVYLWIRFVPAARAVGALVAACAATGIAYVALADSLAREAHAALDGSFPSALFAVFLLACGLAIPAATAVGTALSANVIGRWLALTLFLAAFLQSQLLLREAPPGVHLQLLLGAALLVGAAFAPRTERALRVLAKSPIRRLLLLAAVSIVLLAAALPPSNRVRTELFRQPGSVGAWILARALWSPPALPVDTPLPTSPWFADRTGLGDVPPSEPRIGPANPVVVLVGIEALRADVLDAPHADLFPVLSWLGRSGARFTRASAPGSQTSVVFASLFAGRYFSQLYWSPHGEGRSRFLYPAEDRSPRFPERLTAAGVRTASFLGVRFLAAEFGVARGFAEEHRIAEGRRHARSQELIDPLLAWLRDVGPEPAFAFTHLMDPHAPYGSLRDAPDFERYLSEIARVDHWLRRLVALLRQRFAGRAYLIVTADHGEAFGEHGTRHHSRTLYEELLHVPLLVHGPDIPPRAIAERVGLVDLGPTILDLFGLATPGPFMGESLVPLLAGRDAALDRPVAAEGRLRRAFYQGDLKVIEDERCRLVEVYDLAVDPGERHNLFDVQLRRVAPAVAASRAFFSAHALRRPGYTPPYKP